MEAIIQFWIKHGDAIVTLLIAYLARKVEKPYVVKKTARGIRNRILDGEKGIEVANEIIKDPKA